MQPESVFVFLPCHTLDDFPTWLDEGEADALLVAWTAAWHPAVIVAAGGRPAFASVDLPPPEAARGGVVPPFCDDRFSAQTGADDSRPWVRGVVGLSATVGALVASLGVCPDVSGSMPGTAHQEKFFALGLAALLADLLARRMRSDADLSATGFDEATVAAARAALADDSEAVERSLTEAFACLEATRARYYAVESWTVDLVLAAPTMSGGKVADALESPVPAAIVATGETIRRLAERSPDAIAAIRAAVASGRVEACGGRDDEQPLDTCMPEAIAASFQAGRDAWRDHLGATPLCYAAISGGASAIMPQVLAGHGFRAAIWSLFDGTPLPEPGGSRIRLESGGSGIEVIARPPLDASKAQTVLRLADELGDAFDHDHTAVIQFACYAGTASQWHALLRIIASRCSLLGSFVTPSTLVERSTGASITASFEPDGFAPTPPPDAAGEAIVEATAATREAAVQLEAAQTHLAAMLGHGPPAAIASPAATAPPRRPSRDGMLSRLFARRREDDARALDNGLVRLAVHPRTGGILSLRRPVDRGNRISQQLAVRTTAAASEGLRWSPPEDRAEWTRMEADAIDREGPEAGDAIVSRGRLVDLAGREAGCFRQRVTLVPGLPLAILDLEVTPTRPYEGPLPEAHIACRFAWHENEDVEVARSLHLQSIVTERTLFTAPHFIEIVPLSLRGGPGIDAVTILTGGLPWHLRSSTHVIDSVLAASGLAASVRMAVGIGVERPWDAGLALASGGMPAPDTAYPATIRLTAAPPGIVAERPGTTSIGIVESAGKAGNVRIDWGRGVVRAVAVDLVGRPLPDVHVAVDGQATVVFLNRYQWLHLVVDFVHP